MSKATPLVGPEMGAQLLLPGREGGSDGGRAGWAPSLHVLVLLWQGVSPSSTWAPWFRKTLGWPQPGLVHVVMNKEPVLGIKVFLSFKSLHSSCKCPELWKMVPGLRMGPNVDGIKSYLVIGMWSWQGSMTHVEMTPAYCLSLKMVAVGTQASLDWVEHLSQNELPSTGKCGQHVSREGICEDPEFLFSH
jgi:hypothetical protein